MQSKHFYSIDTQQVFDAFNAHEFEITIVFLAVSSLAAFLWNSWNMLR